MFKPYFSLFYLSWLHTMPKPSWACPLHTTVS